VRRRPGGLPALRLRQRRRRDHARNRRPPRPHGAAPGMLRESAMPVEIAERWFEMRGVDDAITLLWEPHVMPLMRCNIWHVRGRDRDLLIDTGMGISSLREAARDLLEKPVIAVATHTHADHIGGHFEFEDCLVHRDEADRLRHPGGRGTLRGG